MAIENTTANQEGEKMNEVSRLFENITKLIKCGCYEAEAETFANEYGSVTELSELNDLIEEELSLMGENEE